MREVTDSSGNLVGQYDYDAWGNAAVVNGNMTVDFGFTGHYFHQPSGLNLSMYRAYNPTLGRWISRDPIAERAGINLYGYVYNDPTRLTDPLGTDTYWHDMQDTMAGFITGFIPGLPYDSSNDAMRCGREIGLGTNLALVADALFITGSIRAGAALLTDVGAIEGIDALNASDGIASADSCESGLTYDPRIREGGLEDPVGHNFPYSFEGAILEAVPKVQADGSLLYEMPGTINNTGGVFQLGLNPQRQLIFHRAFNGN